MRSSVSRQAHQAFKGRPATACLRDWSARRSASGYGDVGQEGGKIETNPQKMGKLPESEGEHPHGAEEAGRSKAGQGLNTGGTAKSDKAAKHKEEAEKGE